MVGSSSTRGDFMFAGSERLSDLSSCVYLLISRATRTVKERSIEAYNFVAAGSIINMHFPFFLEMEVLNVLQLR